jgi:predicted transposase/invertase (TIGR01784 family)
VVVHPVFADPKTDFVFKRIFGAEARKPLLVALLNHLLELEGEHRVVDVQHLSGDQHVDVPELKLSIADVKCTDASGRRFVVEMQVLKVEGFEKRVVYNASKAYVMQLRNADEYPALCDVVGVTICNFNLWPEQDERGGYKVPMLSRWRMQEQHSGERGLPQVQYAFLELPKYAAGDAPRTLIDRWAYFFLEAKNLTVVPPALSEEPFRGALEVRGRRRSRPRSGRPMSGRRWPSRTHGGRWWWRDRRASRRATGRGSPGGNGTRCFASS